MHKDNKTISAKIKADEIIFTCNKFLIEAGNHGKDTKLFIDGKKLKGARALKLEISCDSLPHLTLEVHPSLLGLEDATT